MAARNGRTSAGPREITRATSAAMLGPGDPAATNKAPANTSKAPISILVSLTGLIMALN
jgi:hypothetical protein